MFESTLWGGKVAHPKYSYKPVCFPVDTSQYLIQVTANYSQITARSKCTTKTTTITTAKLEVALSLYLPPYQLGYTITEAAF